LKELIGHFLHWIKIKGHLILNKRFKEILMAICPILQRLGLISSKESLKPIGRYWVSLSSDSSPIFSAILNITSQFALLFWPMKLFSLII
jgi:hypothetical protein